MFTSKEGQLQTTLETAIMRLYVNTEFSVHQIARQAGTTPEIAQKAINFWRADSIPQNNQGADMANKDKNKVERTKTMAKLRKGEVEYAVDMDSIRGILGEMQGQEALIINRQGATPRVNIRMGELAHT